MPVRDDIKTVLVIGSGPIIIGQAAEFDYAGTQACKALREEGKRVILVNSNPATIMTDEGVADVTYIEPLTASVLSRVIEREAPDGLLATLGGQTGLNLALELSRAGILRSVKLLGTPLSTIEQAEDRELFKQLLVRLGMDVPPSRTVTSLEAALDFAATIGLPVVVRPAFTLGGTGGGVAHTRAELARIAESGLSASPIGQILVEQYLRGWKEIEYEVLRDGSDTCITVCNMENFDPLGIHTGDSIVVAPSQTLSDHEHQMLRSASLRIIRELGVEGGCNIQFALDPHSLQFYVIEVNPRVSRSSALASKATGYPIARVAAKIAIGLRLDEIRNEITGMTVAAFEPALDYCVVKIPRWPFDKFPGADRRLGTQMKATGEVMAIDRTFEAALQKAIRSLELHPATIAEPAAPASGDSDDTGIADRSARALVASDARIFRLLEALRADDSAGRMESLHHETGIDPWFLARLRRIVQMEQRLASSPLTRDLLRHAKRMGFSDLQVEQLSGSTSRKGMSIRALRRRWGILPTYKMVDTCAAEFAALTPYFYSTYEEENEALPTSGKRAVVLGSGPIRIGQGIEFDYCSVRAALELHSAGVQSILINSNPETVSTDFDTSDRLYFEPLDLESVLNVLENEQRAGELPPVITQFGGQTAIGLAAGLSSYGASLLGTSVVSIDLAEDRHRFDELMERLFVPRPRGAAVRTVADAISTAKEIGFPVLVRPSYVLGGRGMEIVRTEDELQRYMVQAVAEFGEHPILIDRYLSGREIEVDAICDGIDILIPGICEHIERAGVHSGDSFAVYPARSLSPDEVNTVADYTRKIALALDIRGLVNVQFVLTSPVPAPDERDPAELQGVANSSNVYVLEVNPRASRTVPFLSKVTGVPMVSLATRIQLGESLSELGYGGVPRGLWPEQPLVAVKGPVFSMAKITGGEMALSPEMKSTGEVLGVDASYPAALSKALLAAHIDIPIQNGVAFVSLADRDKEEALPILRKLRSLGYSFYATPGTATYLQARDIEASAVSRIRTGDDTILSLIREHRVQLVLNTMTGGGGRLREGIEIRDGFEIRRTAVESGVTCLTSLDTARAVVQALGKGGYNVRPLAEYRVRAGG